MADDTVAFQEAAPATLPADGSQFRTIVIDGVAYLPTMIVDPVNPAFRATVGSAGALKVNARRGVTAFTDPAPTTSASVVLAANSSRVTAMIQNVGTVDVYLGPSGVTTSTGLLLEAGATLTDDLSTSAWYGITASGTADLRVCEVS